MISLKLARLMIRRLSFRSINLSRFLNSLIFISVLESVFEVLNLSILILNVFELVTCDSNSAFD